MTTMKKILIWGGLAIGILVILGLICMQMLGNLGLRGTLMKQAIPTDYFEPYAKLPAKMVEHTKNVYSFRLGMDRAMILRTEEGLAVFDCFNEEFSHELRRELLERFPDEPVSWLIYSHNHLDHVRGGAILKPQEVIGHSDFNKLVTDFKHPANAVATVTREISEDETVTLGGVEVKFLFMPQSHSLTLFGFYIPSEDIVFAPDMMFVKVFPPFGLPDWYYPGYIRALDRLIALDAKTYIPSHFNLGTREDLVAYRNMMVDFREVMNREMIARKYKVEGGKDIRKMFAVVYPELKAKYGDWHGFDSMFISHFAGHMGGSFLGY